MNDREPLHPVEVLLNVRLLPHQAGILRRLDEDTPFELTALRFERGRDHTYVNAELVSIDWNLPSKIAPEGYYGPDLLSKRKPHVTPQ